MSSSRYIAVMVLLSLTCTPSPTHGAVIAWTAVVVRVYDANGVLAGTNGQALDQARKALEAASIDVIWRRCPASPSCDAPLAPGELAIRIVRAAAPPRYSGTRYSGTLPLGDAMIDTSPYTWIDLEAAAGTIPQCAMTVTHTSDGGPMAPYTPCKPCGCYFESKATGTPPASCTVCMTSAQCPTGKSCSYGFCE